jgi:hypothetical protein
VCACKDELREGGQIYFLTKKTKEKFNPPPVFRSFWNNHVKMPLPIPHPTNGNVAL